MLEKVQATDWLEGICGVWHVHIDIYFKDRLRKPHSITHGAIRFDDRFLHFIHDDKTTPIEIQEIFMITTVPSTPVRLPMKIFVRTQPAQKTPQ